MQSVYAGGFALAVGLYDLKIDFKTVEPVMDANGAMSSVEEENVPRITLSMPLAKEFYAQLQEAIESYEKTFGIIKSTSELEKIANLGK